MGADHGHESDAVFPNIVAMAGSWARAHTSLVRAPSKYRIFCVCRRRGTHRRSPKSDIFRTHLPHSPCPREMTMEKEKKKFFYPSPLKDIFPPKKWVGPYSTLVRAPSKYRIFCVCRRRGTHRRSPKSDIFRTHLPT